MSLKEELDKIKAFGDPHNATSNALRDVAVDLAKRLGLEECYIIAVLPADPVSEQNMLVPVLCGAQHPVNLATAGGSLVGRALAIAPPEKHGLVLQIARRCSQLTQDLAEQPNQGRPH